MITDITNKFVQKDDKYQYEFDSCTGVLQVEREKSSTDTGIEIFSYLPGMTPYRRMQTGKINLQVDLEFHTGMKLLIVSSTAIKAAKLLRDE